MGLTIKQLALVRSNVIALHQNGQKIMAIVQKTGLSYPAVRTCIDKFEAGGLRAVIPVARGRLSGNGRSLTPTQENYIRNFIIEKLPNQGQIDRALWSREVVGQLIEQTYGSKLHPRSVGKYLARWGFTNSEPVVWKNKNNKDPHRMWIEKIISAEQTKRGIDAEIHVVDAKEFDSARYKPTHAPNAVHAVGSYHLDSKARCRLYSIANQGKIRWMIVKGKVTSAKLLVFMQALTQDTRRKVLVVHEDKPVYLHQTVKNWVASRPARIELLSQSEIMGKIEKTKWEKINGEDFPTPNWPGSHQDKTNPRQKY